jgi:hypothetical protein
MAGTGLILACSVPVFRYALERWPPDPFRAMVFHRGALTPEQEQAVARLKASAANLDVVIVDLAAEPEAALREAWNEQGTDTLPWLYVTYPEAHPVAIELAAGPLEEAGLVESILDTSVRREIGNRLVAGQSAVWVLLESGDEAADEAAWSVLNREIRRLENELELPTIEQEDIDAGLLALDESQLKIAFSSMRLSRENPKDEMFVRMLLDTEDDLLDAEAPIVFPVFGRGRVLYGVVGEGIAPDTLEAAAAYLVGSCSCQVKADNPGVDVLMAVNWEDLVESTLDHDRELPELAGILPPSAAPDSPGTSPSLGSSSEAQDEKVPTSVAGSPALTEADESRRMLWTTLGTLGLMLVLVAGGSALFTTKKL